MSVEILKDDLKNNRIKKLYLFYGPEEYLKRYYLDRLEKQILKEGYEDFNKIVIDSTSDTQRIADACDTMPVFSDRKLVVVRNSSLLKPVKKAGGSDSRKKPKDEGLISILQNLPEYVCLVFSEAEIDKRTGIAEYIRKNGLMVEFAVQKPAELVKWIIKVFKTNGKDIDGITASQMVDRCDQGMNELLGEANKVIMFMGDRIKATKNDIEEVCIKSIKSRIFDLTGAIAERNGSKALKIFYDMMELKEPVPRILFMIARQFRQMLEMKVLSEKGLSLDDSAVHMGMTAYAAGRVLQQAKRFSVDKLKKAIEECLEMDVGIKTGRIDDVTAAELLIARCSS